MRALFDAAPLSDSAGRFSGFRVKSDVSTCGDGSSTTLVGGGSVGALAGWLLSARAAELEAVPLVRPCEGVGGRRSLDPIPAQ